VSEGGEIGSSANVIFVTTSGNNSQIPHPVFAKSSNIFYMIKQIEKQILFSGGNKNMKKVYKLTIITIVLVTVVLGTMAFVSPGVSLNLASNGNGNPGSGGNGRGNPAGGGYSIAPLSEAEKEALNRAILEEYGALNLYQKVISDLGNVAPFSYIVRAEQQHVNALTNQASKYGLPVPPNPGLANAPSFTSLKEACAAGAAAEIADAALYDQLKPTVTHSDILRVFSNLQNASLYNHLPAFQSCQ
jgi:hypothetical protein